MLHPFQFGKDVFDPTNRFVTSWLLPPWALLLVRFLMVHSAVDIDN